LLLAHRQQRSPVLLGIQSARLGHNPLKVQLAQEREDRVIGPVVCWAAAFEDFPQRAGGQIRPLRQKADLACPRTHGISAAVRR
jgi:hypothetical protein